MLELGDKNKIIIELFMTREMCS